MIIIIVIYVYNFDNLYHTLYILYRMYRNDLAHLNVILI